MARPTKRSGSSKDQFRKRVPADVLRVARGKRITFSLPKTHSGDERIMVPAKLGGEVMFSLRTEEPTLIKLRHSAASEQFERACAAFREGPRRLTNKQCHALAGVLYRDMNALFEDEPISADWWRIVANAVQEGATGKALLPLTIVQGSNPEGHKRITAMNRFVAPWLDPILSREGVIPADEDRPALLAAFAQALILSAKKLKRNAEGDYSPDHDANRFPKWEEKTVAATPKVSILTFDSLLGRWEKEDKKAPSSLVSFRQHVAAFKAHLGHNDPRRVTKADAIGWKDALLSKGLKPCSRIHSRTRLIAPSEA